MLLCQLAIFMTLGLFYGNVGDRARSYGTWPCPNYTLWKKAISIDGATLSSSGEFHGDCRITFQVPYPETQRFLLRFEFVNIRECHDRLVIYDSDDLIDSTRLDELSCRSLVDRNRYLYTQNSGGYVTIRYYTYNGGKVASDFRLVLTAVSKTPEAMFCDFRCANNHCIAADLRCDAERINHCGDDSDELNCRTDPSLNDQFDSREFLGLSITVTIIISLSVLFVCGVCVCSIALFVCKRNYHTPTHSIQVTAPTIDNNGILESEGTASSTSRSQITYTPVNTSDIIPPIPNRVYHGKSRTPTLPPFPPMRQDSYLAPRTPRTTVSQHSNQTRTLLSTPENAKRNVFLF